MQKFSTIIATAQKRKGGNQQLKQLLPKPLAKEALREISDNRYLSQMTRCVFNAGFHWSVVSKKWPNFEKAFHGFDIGTLLLQSPQEWEGYLQEEGIIRNWQKIQTVYHNAVFVDAITTEYGSFGRFFTGWPIVDQVGLMRLLKDKGARLGGQTSQYFIRFIGKDGFITSADVVTALIANGVEIARKPSSQRDFNTIQQAFNHWQQQSGLPMSHISRILAMSVGDNIPIETLKAYRGKQAAGDPLTQLQ